MEGTYTALITPFKEGTIDEQGFRENLWFQMDAGVEGVLVLGSTGEGETLTEKERFRLIQIAREETKGKIPLWVQTGDCATFRTLEKTEEAERLGADGVLIITPYYTCPTQEGVIRHFETVAESTHLPIMVYHHPRRSGVRLELETLRRLAKIENIIGMKDASGDISFVAEVLSQLPDFILMSGDDLLILPHLSLGAKGVFSVLSNLMPQKVCELIQNPSPSLYRPLFPYFRFSQCETNPIPIKAMMNRVGMEAGECRLPLTPLSQKYQKQMEALFLTSHQTPSQAGFCVDV